MSSTKSVRRIVLQAAAVIAAFLIAYLVAGLVLPGAVSDAPTAEDAPESVLLTDAELLDGVSQVYMNPDGSYTVTASARGFESDVVLDVGLDSAGAITGVSVVSHGETPDKGGQALSPEYLTSYAGLTASSGVEAFSGATYTSDAIAACVDTAINEYKLLNGIEFETAVAEEDLIAAALGEVFPGGFEQLTGFEPVKETVKAVYKGSEGYAFYMVGPGYYGDELPIKILVCTDASGKVTEIRTIENNETGDNGSQALGENYLALYKGGSSFSLFDISIPGVFFTKIDTLSGATDSCYGVFYLVEAATKQFAALS